MAIALSIAPPALPLLAATRSVAAALSHLHRDVLVARHGLVLVVALCLTDTLSLYCSRRPSASRAAIDATPVCRERARMREIEDGVCGAHRGNALDPSCRRRASRPCCLAKID